MKESSTDDDKKENFCAPCLMAIPAALGVTGAAAGASQNGKDKKFKTILLWGSIALTVISIIIFIYLKTRCTNCK